MGNFRCCYSSSFRRFNRFKVNRGLTNNIKETENTVSSSDMKDNKKDSEYKLKNNEIIGTVTEVNEVGMITVVVKEVDLHSETFLSKDYEVIFTYTEEELKELVDKGIKKDKDVLFELPEQAIATMSLPPQMPNVKVVKIIN